MMQTFSAKKIHIWHNCCLKWMVNLVAFSCHKQLLSDTVNRYLLIFRGTPVSNLSMLCNIILIQFRLLWLLMMVCTYELQCSLCQFNWFVWECWASWYWYWKLLGSAKMCNQACRMPGQTSAASVQQYAVLWHISDSWGWLQ